MSGLNRMNEWEEFWKPSREHIYDLSENVAFKVVADMIYADASHRRTIMDPWIFWSGPHPMTEVEFICNDLNRRWLNGEDFTPEVKPLHQSTRNMKLVT